MPTWGAGLGFRRPAKILLRSSPNTRHLHFQSAGQEQPLVRHRYAGIAWTTLTGAGGGGCAITLVRPDVNEERGRTRTEVRCGWFSAVRGDPRADGVSVLFPAVLGNDPGENGEEIDHRKV